MLTCNECSIPASGGAENEPPATQKMKKTGDLDAATKEAEARSKIQKICQEIRSVHKEDGERPPEQFLPPSLVNYLEFTAPLCFIEGCDPNTSPSGTSKTYK